MSVEKVKVVLCWHMHQPLYRDTSSNEYILPWTYLHAIKDYIDMVDHIENAPSVKVVVNFAPTLLEQLDDYAKNIKSWVTSGSKLRDPLLAALVCEDLSAVDNEQREKIIKSCLRANEERLIKRFPHYSQLASMANQLIRNKTSVKYLSEHFLSDLLVWYHLAWMGETVRKENAFIQLLIEKKTDYTLEERKTFLKLIGELVEDVIPRYRKLAEAGQIELAFSPYAHPIVPLLLDLKSAREAAPEMPLPQHEKYEGGKERAEWHFRHGKTIFKNYFGFEPVGCWPSEGSVSEDTLKLCAEMGIRWIATGENVANLSRLSIDNVNLFEKGIAKGGVTDADIEALSPKLDKLRTRIQHWLNSETQTFFNLPFKTNVKTIKQKGQQITRRFKRAVVFGIGGSSLGGEMLVRVLGDVNPKTAVSFYDNVDPSTMVELEKTKWDETLLLVISKSGNTAETLSQFLTILPVMEHDLGYDKIPEHVLIITENKDGALFQLAKELDIEVIEHPPVGGRFSVLSVVGLLPAYIGGVDIAGVMEGARAMAQRCAEDSMLKNPAFYNGAAQYLHSERGRTISVVMPYADNLRFIVNWFRQLWAESLGKIDKNGRHRGLTPTEAHGVTDQHSQLQLLLEGPDDKLITFITDPGFRFRGRRVPMRFQHIPAIKPLAGHTIGELFISELKATRTTLSRRGRPNRTLALLERDAYAIGELIILLEMETVVVAELMGIDAFDQPAVEESKVLTREYLGELQIVSDLI